MRHTSNIKLLSYSNMSNHTIIQISDSLKQDIIKTLIEPGYKDNVRRNILLKKKYADVGLVFELLSKVFIGVSSIISFSAGIYQYQLLAFFAGVGSVASLIFLQFSSYSFRQSKLISDELNKILEKLHIDTLPDDIGSSENQPNNSTTVNSPAPILINTHPRVHEIVEGESS